MQKQALVRFEKYRFVKEGGQLIARGGRGALGSHSIRNCKWCNFFTTPLTLAPTNQQ